MEHDSDTDSLTGEPGTERIVRSPADALTACREALMLRVGSSIGRSMIEKALSSIGRAPDALTASDMIVFRRLVLRSASVFLSDRELSDLGAAFEDIFGPGPGPV